MGIYRLESNNAFSAETGESNVIATLKLEQIQNRKKGNRVVVQVPDHHAQQIVDAVLSEQQLNWGDYDCVTFRSAVGIQQFRSVGTGRNVATKGVAEVSCVELSFFLNCDDDAMVKVIKKIYWAHPYEEPVVFVSPSLRTLHNRGMDEDNPNRFWNGKPEDWLPEEHR